jgi:hypothetical protein
MIQKYSSEASSMKQVPAGFKIVDKYFGWKPNTVNFDIGGGKYDLFSEKLREKNVTNLVYDPYNRTAAHNLMILEHVLAFNTDTATIFNVLNVVMECEVQLMILLLAYNGLKRHGQVFVRSTYMNPNKASGLTKSGTYQHYLKQEDYLKIVKEIFHDAKLEHGIIHAHKWE